MKERVGTTVEVDQVGLAIESLFSSSGIKSPECHSVGILSMERRGKLCLVVAITMVGCVCEERGE